MAIALLILLAAVVLVVIGRGWLSPALLGGQWRMGAGLLSLGAFTAAAFLAVRGSWDKGLALAVAGAIMMFAARSRRGERPRRRGAAQEPGALTLEGARAILGVGPEATDVEIRAAHARLIRRVHPDHGGTDALAAQLNAARDRLLRERKGARG